MPLRRSCSKIGHFDELHGFDPHTALISDRGASTFR
jgi:hypothetical protein